MKLHETTSEGIHRAADPGRGTVEQMGVDRRRLDVLMAQELLDRADVVCAFQQVGAERMPERVASGAFGQTRRHDGIFDRFLNQRSVNVMPPLLARLGIAPPEVSAGSGQLGGSRVPCEGNGWRVATRGAASRQPLPPEAVSHLSHRLISSMLMAEASQVLCQLRPKGSDQEGSGATDVGSRSEANEAARLQGRCNQPPPGGGARGQSSRENGALPTMDHVVERQRVSDLGVTIFIAPIPVSCQEFS